jgi:peptidoglycan/xylan/chitin deacetylase (PgdA/CDA1 family)
MEAVSAVDAWTYDQGGITRGARNAPRIALIFTGGEFAEGADAILDALAERDVKASFFVTGDFIRTREFDGHLRRMVREGHYLGAHSDAHLLYAPWEDRSTTLVTEAEFRSDLEKNLADLERFGRTREQMRFFIPPYEWYNSEIVGWAEGLGLVLFNYTSGTRSNADYMPDSAARFISSAGIVESILDHEEADPDGLNGFLLLLHVGAGPERTDKMHPHVGPLIDELRRRGYSFVRVDELLAGAPRRRADDGTFQTAGTAWPTWTRTAPMSRISRTSTHPVSAHGNCSAMRIASSMFSASTRLKPASISFVSVYGPSTTVRRPFRTRIDFAVRGSSSICESFSRPCSRNPSA